MYTVLIVIKSYLSMKGKYHFGVLFHNLAVQIKIAPDVTIPRYDLLRLPGNPGSKDHVLSDKNEVSR